MELVGKVAIEKHMYEVKSLHGEIDKMYELIVDKKEYQACLSKMNDIEKPIVFKRKADAEKFVKDNELSTDTVVFKLRDVFFPNGCYEILKKIK